MSKKDNRGWTRRIHIMTEGKRMSTETLGVVRVVNIGNVRIEVSAVYPNQDEDASPTAYQVVMWNKTLESSMTLEEVSKLLAAFGGISNHW